MEKKQILISSTGKQGFRLRTISQQDIEKLRVWKNSKKSTCFLNEDISPEQQQEWYRGFINREHDYMFIVEQEAEDGCIDIGCMGFRLLDNEGCIDAYNIIRANKTGFPLIKMGDAFCIMLGYAACLFDNLPIRSKVLITNPAVSWYQLNHFFIVRKINNYYLVEFDKSCLSKYDWKIKKMQK